MCNSAWRLRHHEFVAHHLHVYARAYNGREWGAEARLDGTQDTLTIVRRFESLWQDRLWAKRGSKWRPFAQVAITLSGLTPVSKVAPSLFEEPRPLTPLSKAMDRINTRWGRNTVYFASAHNCRHEMEDKVAFGRIPEEGLNGSDPSKADCPGPLRTS